MFSGYARTPQESLLKAIRSSDQIRDRITSRRGFIASFGGRSPRPCTEFRKKLQSLANSTAEASQSGLKRRQRFRADMVLDAFSVHFRHPFGDANGTQELNDGFMPAFARRRQFPSGVREKNGAVGLRGDVAGFLQPGDGSVHGNVRHAETPGTVERE